MLHFRRLTRMLTAVVTVLAFAVAMAACGGGAPSSGPSTPVPSGVVPIQAKDFAFEPATITVPAGSVTFSIKNGGSQEHEFEIFKGETVVDEIEGIVPGLTRDLTVTLEAGDYTFMCLLNGHDQLGMKGTLTVTGG